MERHLALTTVLAAAALALAGCGREDASTVGQQADTAAESAARSADNAAQTAEAKIDDAGITASINAELAKDPTLSALAINVDTSNGRVVLRGTAPDPAAKDRATQLAQSVKGVAEVDNQLEVRG